MLTVLDLIVLTALIALGLTVAFYSALAAMSPEEREAALHYMSPEDKAKLLNAMSPKDRAAAMAAMSPAEKAAAISEMSPADKAKMMVCCAHTASLPLALYLVFLFTGTSCLLVRQQQAWIYPLTYSATQPLTY